MTLPAIYVENLTRYLGDFLAVDHVSFDIQPGEIVGFVGPNGSGKTSTIRMLLGLLAPSERQASVLGFDSFRESEEVRSRCGYMSQKFAIYDDLTVWENLQFYGGVYGLTGRSRIGETLTHVGLTGHETDLTRGLSAGWRQRLALAIALVHQPQLLFLDEPTPGVDPNARRAFWDLTTIWQAGRGDGVRHHPLHGRSRILRADRHDARRQAAGDRHARRIEEIRASRSHLGGVRRTAGREVWGAFHNAGQNCAAIERVYVVKAVAEAFIERVVALAKKVRRGDYVSVLTTARQRRVVVEQLEEAVAAGAEGLVGGPPEDETESPAPTVLRLASDEPAVMRDEAFGPVLPIRVVDDVDEAIERANDCRYGLGVSVWTRRASYGHELARRLRGDQEAAILYRQGLAQVLAYAQSQPELFPLEPLTEKTTVHELF